MPALPNCLQVFNDFEHNFPSYQQVRAQTANLVLMFTIVTLALTTWLATTDVGFAQRGPTRAAPEAATGLHATTRATARSFMVSAANPLAVDAGNEILTAGGSAVDAAIAVQMVLNLVEPQSSGIGGGAFLLHYDAAAKTLITYDGRETAPRSARPDRFLKSGRPMPFFKAVHSGLSIGVPGLVRMLADAHAKHGRLKWSRLFDPASRLATDGFEISPRLNGLLKWMGHANFAPRARRYFFDDQGIPRAVGTRLINLAFAATLRELARNGPDAFYTGKIAQAIVDAARNAPNAPSDMTLEDLANYRAVVRQPVCSTYRKYRICGMGPPSSGAITVAQTLALVEAFDLGRGPDELMSARAMHIIGEAQKLAYADRARYLADPDFVTVPQTMLNPGYIRSRRDLISLRVAAAKVQPGTPPDVRKRAFGHDASTELPGTSHISIVDADGNVVSMTTTIESAFGSRVMTGGFLLNNELTDFSMRAVDRDGTPIANRVEAGKRPRSSMAPTIVFDPDGNFFAAIGSPGGSRIILYVTKALVAMIDWGLDPQRAAALINFGSRGRGFELEMRPWSWTREGIWQMITLPDPKPAIWHAINLKAFGHRLRLVRMTSGLQIIMKRGDLLIGGADPRREGVARGQ